LATITSDPPDAQRGISVTNVYVRPDGNRLRELARQLGNGRLQIPVAAAYPLADAGRALAEAVGGHTGGAIVLRL
jgi:NADPH:quinone reductase-like Zn-dependent oxidoreductase